MKLNNNQWKTLSMILENRGYRYFDKMDDNCKVSSLDKDDRKEYNIWNNIKNRISSSKEDSTQRFTPEQKEYIINMLEEYQLCNITEADIEYEYCNEIITMLKPIM